MMYPVCFCRLMSQLADVNIQSSVGMFSFVLYSSFCYQRCTRLVVLCSQISRWFCQMCCTDIYSDLHFIRHNASQVWTLDSMSVRIFKLARSGAVSKSVCSQWFAAIRWYHHLVVTTKLLSIVFVLVIEQTLTDSYLLKGENQPYCQACQSALTVKHIACTHLSAMHERYFRVDSLKELFWNCRLSKDYCFYYPGTGKEHEVCVRYLAKHIPNENALIPIFVF